MLNTVLAAAAAVALSLPSVAQPHGYDAGYRPPPPAPAYAERREVAELRQLVARLDAPGRGQRARREVAWVEAELLRACERELAEARAARATGWREVPGTRRYQQATWSEPVRARLDALRGVRAGLLDVQGRTDWRSIRQARSLGVELTRLAALDVRYDAPPPPPPAYDRGYDRGHEGRDHR